MPKDKDFKRHVRKRMAETGERYTQARVWLVGPGAASRSTPTGRPFPTSSSVNAALAELAE